MASQWWRSAEVLAWNGSQDEHLAWQTKPEEAEVYCQRSNSTLLAWDSKAEQINELKDAVYDNGHPYVWANNNNPFDLSELSLDDKYDYGRIDIYRKLGNAGVSIHTLTSDGFVYLSDTEFTNDENKPIKIPYGYYTKNIFHEPILDHIMPYELIAKSLEHNTYNDKDVATFIKQFDLDDTYVEEFFKAYPQYKTQSFSPVLHWILEVFG